MSAAKSKARKPVFAARPKEKNEWDRLPFIGIKRGESRFWNLPFTGSYLTGIEVGRDVARLFFQFAIGEIGNKHAFASSLLRDMLRGLLEKEALTPAEQDVKNGQYVGFTEEVAAHALGSAYLNGAGRLTNEQLIARINRNLCQEPADALQRAIEAHDALEARAAA